MQRLISGGASGSDNVFATCALNKNISVDIHSFIRHNVNIPTTKNKPNLILHTEEELNMALPYLKYANMVLRRKIPPKGYIRNLLCRNYYQIKETDCAIAVGYYDPEHGIMKGGTGWAVQMALDLGKPAYVFDLNNNEWLCSKVCIPKEPNLNSYNFVTGIGTRNLTPRGANEIKSLFEVIE
jgi:hypothetical protein